MREKVAQAITQLEMFEILPGNVSFLLLFFL